MRNGRAIASVSGGMVAPVPAARVKEKRVAKILIVEDEPNMVAGLRDNFEYEGYEVITAPDGVQGLARALAESPDIVLLDVMMPRMSGLDVCKQLKAKRPAVPIIMLTARGQEVDKVVGLELGADDYVTKPFSLRELLARVQALLRRATPESATSETPEEISFGNVHIDSKALRGKRGRETFDLTPRELKVLAVLWRERGNAVARDSILNEVWGIEYYGTTRTLDQLVVKLRQKVEDKPGEPRWLVTVHGHGYRLEAE